MLTGVPSVGLLKGFRDGNSKGFEYALLAESIHRADPIHRENSFPSFRSSA
jgi:hypothetical protein